jgi:hypothetical protein
VDEEMRSGVAMKKELKKVGKQLDKKKDLEENAEENEALAKSIHRKE